VSSAIPKGQIPAVVLINPKYEHNVGAALRNCAIFDIPQLWWTGHRVTIDKDRGERLPREERMRGYKHVTWTRCDTPFDQYDSKIPVVCIELCRGAELLTDFQHPDHAVYVFGPEDGSVDQMVKRHCHRFVCIPANDCANLSVAIGVTLAHRKMQRQLDGTEPRLPPGEMLNKFRGVLRPPLDVVEGWDGH
jgi:tRNA(Leu) C34 or U34 (ribose-2'-O)-methylase TrmL